jgi:hypothetical protein
LLRRKRVVKDLAERLGFRGRVEYVHVFSQSGGAQFGLGQSEANDVLVVYAEAFVRDANPRDFSLAAMMAHERGHQLIFRHSAFRKWLAQDVPDCSEEIVASIVGALIVWDVADHDALLDKAFDEAINCGAPPRQAAELIKKLRKLLEAMLCSVAKRS